MVTLRCTRKLLKRIGPQPRSHGLAATCALGNWFANIVYLHSQPFVIAVSERAFIAVFFPARALREGVGPAFLQAVASLLLRIGAPRGTVERELALMSPTLIAPTNSHQVVGVMNQYALDVRFIERERLSLSLPELELHFASGVTGALRLTTPQEAALSLLSAVHAVM